MFRNGYKERATTNLCSKIGIERWVQRESNKKSVFRNGQRERERDSVSMYKKVKGQLKEIIKKK